MALKLKCPCGERLVAPESAAGKRARCSKCGRKFIIPDPNSIAKPARQSTAKENEEDGIERLVQGEESPDFDMGAGDILGDTSTESNLALKKDSLGSPTTLPETTAAHSRPSEQADFDLGSLIKVRMGLNLVFYGVLCVLIGFLIIPLAYVSNWSGFFQLADALFFAVAPMLMNAGVLLGLIGRIICLSVPKEIKGAWAIYAAVACDIGTVVASVGYHAGMLPGIFRLLGPIGFFLFVFFLKKLSVHIRDGVSEARSDSALKLFTVVGILATVFVVGIYLFPEDKSFELYAMTFVIALSIMMIVSVLLIVILYVRLLLSLRRSLNGAEVVAEYRQRSQR